MAARLPSRLDSAGAGVAFALLDAETRAEASLAALDDPSELRTELTFVRLHPIPMLRASEADSEVTLRAEPLR